MIVIVSLIFMSVFGSSASGTEEEQILILSIKAASGTGIILWFWMIYDLFMQEKLKYKKIWGLSFLLFNVIAAIAYFIIIYLPWNKKK
jgi:hypothetical protein